jgi:RecA-family ATPase
VCQHYGIAQSELEGWLFVTTGAEVPLRVAEGYANLAINDALIKQMREGIGDLKIDVCSLDPLITLHGVPEGDNGKMYRVIRVFADIGDEMDCAFELSHHTRKGPAGGNPYEYTADDMRGASAVRDAVRAARILNHMSVAEAEEVGIPEHDRASYFRADRAKGNYSRPAKVATWRQFVSVELPNEDDVGVVVPWNFPGQGASTPEKTAADQKAEHVFLQLLDKFAAQGVNVSANSGPTYAPAKFAGEKEARTAKVSKAALKAAMSRLLDAGRIRSEPYGRGDRSSHRLVPWQGTPQ